MAVMKIRNDADDDWIIVGGGVTVVQQAGEPGTTYPGMLWVDTDADNPGNSIIEDDDNDTSVQCEKTADIDRVHVTCNSIVTARFDSTSLTILGDELASARLYLAADQGDDNADWWRVQASTGGGFSVSPKASGSYVEALEISGDGEVTHPTNPAFCINLDSNRLILTAELSTWVTIDFDDEKYDVTSDFNTGTFTFTAPVTGKYLLTATMYFLNLDMTAAFYSLALITSNRTYSNYLEPDAFDIDCTYWPWQLASVVDMDVNDQAYIAIYQSAGAEQTSVNLTSYFTGVLVA